MEKKSNLNAYNKAVFKYRNDMELDSDDYIAVMNSMDESRERIVPTFCSAESSLRDIISYDNQSDTDILNNLAKISEATIIVIDKWGEHYDDEKPVFYFLTDKDYDKMERLNGSGDITYTDYWLSLLKKGISCIARNKENKDICCKICISLGIIILNLMIIQDKKEASLV